MRKVALFEVGVGGVAESWYLSSGMLMISQETGALQLPRGKTGSKPHPIEFTEYNKL